MADEVNKRSYRSPLRDEQARETRRRIQDTAARLFVADGYGATSMTAIAAAAGVSTKTVFLAFPAKSDLLNAVVRAAVAGGGDGDLAVAQRLWFTHTLAAPPAQMLELFATYQTDLHARSAAIMQMAEAAAAVDPRVAEARNNSHHRRRADLQRIAEAFVGKTDAPLLDTRTVTDLLYTLSSVANYISLVSECAWPPERYTHWLINTLHAALLDPTHRIQPNPVDQRSPSDARPQ